MYSGVVYEIFMSCEAMNPDPKSITFTDEITRLVSSYESKIFSLLRSEWTIPASASKAEN